MAQTAIETFGAAIFREIENQSVPLFSRQGVYGRLIDWTMRDERFKTGLFRFVDVLPVLRSSSEVVRHLREYLADEKGSLSPAAQAALTISTWVPGLAGPLIRRNVSSLARQFVAAENPRSLIPYLRKLRSRGIGYTVDLLGEAVVSESEAETHLRRNLDTLDILSTQASPPGNTPQTDNDTPDVNLSVKISALYSQINPADPEDALRNLKNRLRPILRKAARQRAFINFDMESYALKNLTLDLFKSIFEEPEFSQSPACGIAIQAYLRDTVADLDNLLDWGRSTGRPFTVRLVKGAYWDYEQTVARQRGWPIPVFSDKVDTDANYERLARILLERSNLVTPAFGTHNIRTISHAACTAKALGRTPDSFEFQMLYGMADPIKDALVRLGYRIREYCPVGEMLPGMAYLVRRLLENTSNEGFLRHHFSEKTPTKSLLANPAESLRRAPRPVERAIFVNEPARDFSQPETRTQFQSAITSVRGDLGRDYGPVINGRAVKTPNLQPSLNPANPAEIVGRVAWADSNLAREAIAAARAKAPAWAATPVRDRCKLLLNLADQLATERDRLAALEIFEVGKTWTEADADVTEAIDFCRFYAREMERLGGRLPTQPVAGEDNYRFYRPRGVGVIIAPWNFPLAILTGMTAAALVTGNTVIIKPAEQSSVIAAWLMNALSRANVPVGVASFVPGSGEEIGPMLVEHPDVDFITFTGSREVGTKIWESAGRTHPGQINLKRVVCEMGGKNALIIDADADLDEAIPGAIKSAFGFQGQKCSAMSRLILFDDIYEAALDRFVSAAADLSIGPPERPATRIGPVIDAAAQKKIQNYIELGKLEATTAFQGTRPQGAGFFVPPTIFTAVAPESRLAREEIFGPVVCVFRARNLDDAIALANDTPFALTGGIYSRSPDSIEKAKRSIAVGNLYINRPITGSIVGRQPFGGFKMSGAGTQAGGRDYLLNFMTPRTISENTMRRGFSPDL